MKIVIENYCIRCGICIDLYPEIYKRNWEDDYIEVIIENIPDELRQKALDSARDCAVTAIKLKDLNS